MAKFTLNERELLEPILEDGFSYGRANKYELILLAKHYKWDLGYGAQKIKKALVDFCKEHDPNFNPVISRDFLQDVVNIGENYQFREAPPVKITDAEIRVIRSIRNFDHQKLLFVLLVTAKMFKFSSTDVSNKSSNKQNIGYYIKLGMLTKIKNIADLERVSTKDSLMILHEFYKRGLINPVLTNSIQILYAYDMAKPVMVVENVADAVSQYIEHVGGEILYCSVCGVEFDKEGNKKDLCPSCNEDRIREQTRKRVRRYRNRQD